ncbi:MAG: hypothetical protein J6J17_03450 [Bacilli bacterium]|nr:hypothetical protein [Bacilli bacterium]
MVVTKFEDIEKGFNEIVEQYKKAKQDDNKSLLSELEKKYEKQRRLLYSNEYYFANLTRRKARKYSKKVQKELLYQKKNYKDNILYIDMIEASDSIESYIGNQSIYMENVKKDTNKKRNFVKRHFNKFVLGAGIILSLTAGLIGLGSCNKRDKSNKNQTRTESTTNDIIDDTKNIINNIPQYFQMPNEGENNKNEEDNKINQVTKTESSKDNNLNKESSISSKPEVTIIPLNPGVSNSDGNTTTIVQDESLKEPTAVTYEPLYSNIGYFSDVEFGPSIIIKEEHEFLDNPSIIDENANSSNSKDDIIINEEKPGETDTNVPIEEDDSTQEDKKEDSTDKDSMQIPEKEQETIIEKEEQTDIDNPTKIEDDTIIEEDKKEDSTDKDNMQIPEKEQETIIEKEEQTDIDNPTEIEDNLATPTDAYKSDLSKEELQSLREILYEVNNPTEIGRSYTLSI